MPHRSLSELMSQAARELENQPDSSETMQTAVDVATRDIDAADGATVSLILRGGSVQTLAASSDAARRCDELQYELGEGPCLDGAWEGHVIHSPDLEYEQRWPRWAARATAETGYRCAMAFELFTTGDAVGGLNLYSSQVRGFDATDRDYGVALASHVAIAVRGAQEVEQLHRALDSRTAISQAVGILMERYGVPADVAFAVLTRVSSTTNTKLRDIAVELCSTGNLPGGQPATATQRG